MSHLPFHLISLSSGYLDCLFFFTGYSRIKPEHGVSAIFSWFFPDPEEKYWDIVAHCLDP